jgi:hypothetical protein
VNNQHFMLKENRLKARIANENQRGLKCACTARPEVDGSDPSSSNV